MSVLKNIFIAFGLFLILGRTAHAIESAPKQKLGACLKKAEELPDIAAANADLWLKQGGGEYAHLCHASAKFNAGEFLVSAQEFQKLAELHVKTDRHHAAELYARAGLGYMRAGNSGNAETMYGKAVTLEPDDPEFWVDRATGRAEDERYWDAISDLNRALEIMPDLSEALRLRAQAWVKLGNNANAERDFLAAEQVDAEDGVKPGR